MHGTVMRLYATPILFGFANYVVPLQIGFAGRSGSGGGPARRGAPLSRNPRSLASRYPPPSSATVSMGKPEHGEVVDPRPDAVEDAGAAVRQDQPRVRAFPAARGNLPAVEPPVANPSPRGWWNPATIAALLRPRVAE